jgi:60 kDa SS-A/Ro ribonucleoprotein
MSKVLNAINEREPKAVGERVNERQVLNSTGGYVFSVDDKVRAERFLILGTETSTYYASAKDLTKQNYGFLKGMANKNARGLVDIIVDVSTNARAPKNSPAIFALAVALFNAPDADKAYVKSAVPKVCRTATHLFEFAQYVENLGGWGRAKRSAVASWYENKSRDDLAFQAIKYRSRTV